MDEFPTSGPIGDSCDDHEHRRDPEAGEGANMVEQPGTQEHGDAGAKIDREVEPAIEFRQQMLVRFTELVTDVGRDTRLDHAGADRRQKQTEEETGSRSVHSHRDIPDAIKEREIDDRLVFGQPDVGDQRSEEG